MLRHVADVRHITRLALIALALLLLLGAARASVAAASEAPSARSPRAPLSAAQEVIPVYFIPVGNGPDGSAVCRAAAGAMF